MLGNFPMERYLLTCLTFWTRGSILINYKVRLRLPREELICDWIKAAQLYIHQQDPDLILTTPTISRNQQCWPSWVEGIGWRGRPLANIGRQRNAASCLAPPLLHHGSHHPPQHHITLSHHHHHHHHFHQNHHVHQHPVQLHLHPTTITVQLHHHGSHHPIIWCSNVLINCQNHQVPKELAERYTMY